ncbi:hypothetical protein NL676_019187 [Syzygium grande]|nr:hypothetical protein NL676_019187 [Syzygium grande]
MCSERCMGILGMRSGWGKLAEDVDALEGTICYEPFNFGPALLQQPWRHKAALVDGDPTGSNLVYRRNPEFLRFSCTYRQFHICGL